MQNLKDACLVDCHPKCVHVATSRVLCPFQNRWASPTNVPTHGLTPKGCCVSRVWEPKVAQDSVDVGRYVDVSGPDVLVDDWWFLAMKVYNSVGYFKQLWKSFSRRS